MFKRLIYMANQEFVRIAGKEKRKTLYAMLPEQRFITFLTFTMRRVGDTVSHRSPPDASN